MSPTSWTASTASTSGSCARPAPTWPSTTSTPPACSSTSTGSRGSRRGDRSRVYDLVDRLRRRLAGQVPQAWTPHWMRHSHATALLLSGVPVHVVSRRLGHADVQTTLNTYAHVTEDAEMRAVARLEGVHRGLANRRALRRADRVAARDRIERRAADGLGGSGPRRLRPAGAGRPVGGGAGRRCGCPASPSRLSHREYAAAFCHDGDLAGRGGPVARCRSRCAGRWRGACSASSSWAGRSRHRHVSMLVRRLGEVIADRAGRAPASLLGLSAPGVVQQIRAGGAPPHGRAAGGHGTISNMRQAADAADAAAGHRPTTPARGGSGNRGTRWRTPGSRCAQHEPMGRHAVHFAPDHHPVAAARPAVALQGRPGHRGVDAGRRCSRRIVALTRVRRVPGRPRRRAGRGWPTTRPGCAR